VYGKQEVEKKGADEGACCA